MADKTPAPDMRGSSAKKQRNPNFDVFELEAETGTWQRLNTGPVPASSRGLAIDEKREGRYGTFATVLHGQFVTHEVKSPDEQTEQAIFDELTEHLPDVPEAEVREMAAAAVRRARKDPA